MKLYVKNLKPHEFGYGDYSAEYIAIEQADPNGLSAKAPGAKLDAQKTPVFRGLINYFPRALEAVARLSAIGAQKYSWGGWSQVDDGPRRYTDALLRHLLATARGEFVDSETKLPHDVSVAWNSLARLELRLCREEQLEKEKEKENASSTNTTNNS